MRLFWDDYARNYTEEVLKYYNVWFLVDKNATDWENVTLHLKSDRQIVLFSVIAFVMSWWALVSLCVFLIWVLAKVFDIRPEDL